MLHFRNTSMSRINLVYVTIIQLFFGWALNATFEVELNTHFVIRNLFLHLGLNTRAIILSFISIHLEAAEKVTHKPTEVGHHAGLSLRFLVSALQLADANLITALYFAY